MPPLPENGSTIETAVVDLDPSPVPSANSREEEIAEATEEEAQPVASKKSKRRKIRLAPLSSSSPSKDDATSHSPPRKEASPLRACPLSSMPPAPATGDIVFGGPGSIPSLSDDDERYVLLFCELFLTAMLFPLSGVYQCLLYYQRCGGRYQSSTRSRCLHCSRGLSCECAIIPAAGGHTDYSCSICRQGRGSIQPCGFFFPSCHLGRTRKCFVF